MVGRNTDVLGRATLEGQRNPGEAGAQSGHVDGWGYSKVPGRRGH